MSNRLIYWTTVLNLDTNVSLILSVRLQGQHAPAAAEVHPIRNLEIKCQESHAF